VSKEIIKRQAELIIPQCEITEVGIIIGESVNFEQWKGIGQFLDKVEGTTQWMRGDWLAFGLERGERWGWGKLKKVVDKLNWNYFTAKHIQSVAIKFKERGRRRPRLSFGHHIEVAPFKEEKEQDYWLDEAWKNNWSQKQLRKKIEITKRKARYKEKEIEFDKLPSGVEMLECGRFQDVTKRIADNSIDAIITDPPYGEEYFDCWLDLAEIAIRILKPSGFLIVYSGDVNLDKIYNMFYELREYFAYYYQFVLLHKGVAQLVPARNIFSEYKPILVYQKLPFKRISSVLGSVIEGKGREKELHKWQQAEGELDGVIEAFTEPNDLILDPMAGSGTIAVDCLRLKRRMMVIDEEEENVNIIRGRTRDEKN